VKLSNKRRSFLPILACANKGEQNRSVTMMMAMEGRVRKVHRRSWPALLNRMIPPSVWRAWAGEGDEKRDGRTRWTDKYIVLALVLMGWSARSSLTQRFGEAREALVAWFYDRRRPGGTFPGLLKAAARIDVERARGFWECLREELPSRLRDVWTWYGWIPFAVDGSREDTTRTEANEAALDLAGREQTHPQWWMTWLVHLPSLQLWDWRQGPGTSSERGHLLEMLGGLLARALIVADAGYVGFEFLSRIGESGRHFLIRCGSNVRLLVEGELRSIDELHDRHGVYVWPAEHGDRPPLRVRVIVLKRGGKRVYLLTNVLEPARLSRAMASDIYSARWGIEVNYRGFKQTMERSKVRSKTPAPGAMELAGNILAMALLRLHGAIMLGARVARLSVATALVVIRRVMEALRYGAPTGKWLTALRDALIDDYERRSSKRTRHWPSKKREKPPRPPKVRRVGKRETARIHASLLAAEVRNG
jgi:hypothetical protein